MKEERAREFVRTMAANDLPVPSWTHVTVRATLEDQLAVRRAPFTSLIWIETAIYAGAGIAIAALSLWLIVAW